jgi:hypothetical protein
MKRFMIRLRGLALLLCASVPGVLFAASPCEQEAKWVGTDSNRHFMVLAGRTGVFYERSGPTFVMLIKTAADESAIGALGVYAGDNKQPVFGAVPASTYEEFLHEPRKDSDVMLRLEITGPQYDRALQVLQSWDRRVRERALLYPDIALDNILLVKQVTQELNRCARTLVPYELDWGLADDISEHNGWLRIPFEYFKELKRLNGARHVPDADMPAALLLARAADQRQAVDIKE